MLCLVCNPLHYFGLKILLRSNQVTQDSVLLRTRVMFPGTISIAKVEESTYCALQMSTLGCRDHGIHLYSALLLTNFLT